MSKCYYSCKGCVCEEEKGWYIDSGGNEFEHCDNEHIGEDGCLLCYMTETDLEELYLCHAIDLFLDSMELPNITDVEHDIIEKAYIGVSEECKTMQETIDFLQSQEETECLKDIIEKLNKLNVIH